MGGNESKQGLEKGNRNLSSEIHRKDQEVRVIRHDIRHLNDQIRDGRDRIEREEKESRRMRRMMEDLDYTNQGLEYDVIKQMQELKVKEVQIEQAKYELEEYQERMMEMKDDLQRLLADMENLEDEKREAEIYAARKERECEMLVWRNHRDRETYEERQAIMDRQAERDSNKIQFLCNTISSGGNAQSSLPWSTTKLALTDSPFLSNKTEEPSSSYLHGLLGWDWTKTRMDHIQRCCDWFIPTATTAHPEYHEILGKAGTRIKKKLVPDTPKTSSSSHLEKKEHKLNWLDYIWFLFVIFCLYTIYLIVFR